MVSKDEFLKECIDRLSAELTREKYSGEFDDRVAGLTDIYFGRTPEEREKLLECNH